MTCKQRRLCSNFKSANTAATIHNELRSSTSVSESLLHTEKCSLTTTICGGHSWRDRGIAMTHQSPCPSPHAPSQPHWNTGVLHLYLKPSKEMLNGGTHLVSHEKFFGYIHFWGRTGGAGHSVYITLPQCNKIPLPISERISIRWLHPHMVT